MCRFWTSLVWQWLGEARWRPTYSHFWQLQGHLNQTKHDQQVQAEPGLQVPQSCVGEALLDSALHTQASSAILMHLKPRATAAALLDPSVGHSHGMCAMHHEGVSRA